jgi:FixJ family two-component response regulator
LVGRERFVFDAITGRTLAPCVACERDCVGGIADGRCDSYLRRIGTAIGVSPETVNEYRVRVVAKARAVVLRRSE